MIKNNCDGMRCNFLWSDKECASNDDLLKGMKYIFKKMMEKYDGDEFVFKETNIRLLFRRVMMAHWSNGYN